MSEQTGPPVDDGAVEPFTGRLDAPYQSPVQPHELRLDDAFQFGCHAGISCFNACCKNIDIQILPYDILRLKRRLKVDSREFVTRYTVAFEMDHHGMPGLKLLTKPHSTECVFVTEKGCSVYADRPMACRYYALGSMGVRMKDSPRVDDVFFVVKENHCKGHLESKTQTVREYRQEQGVDVYDAMNREWRDIVIKKRSSGPTVGQPTARSLQLFDMCSYDMDSFRDFIRSPGFQEVFALNKDTTEALMTDEDKLLQFSFRFLKQVLFGEMSIPRKAGAREKRLARAKRRRVERQKEMAGQKLQETDERCDNPNS
ncbi:MAG: YkgJ family cysteine cluster protein [Gammaproteobacteria bacterium]|nr:YkgJ family cysteine cluster protein [Gammaproteobacteria bacterium]